MSSILGASGARLGVMRLGAVGDGSPPPEPPEDTRVVRRMPQPILLPPPELHGHERRKKAPFDPDAVAAIIPVTRTPVELIPPDLIDGSVGHSRRHGRPPFVAPPSGLIVRRFGRTVQFDHPPSSHARSLHPGHSNIGGDLAVVGYQRTVRAEFAPLPSRAVRRHAPAPGPEPEVLPHRRDVRVEPLLAEVAVNGAVSRRYLVPGVVSPAIPEPCPYLPGAQDQAESQQRTFVDQEESTSRSVVDGGDSFPTRIDECS